MNDTCTFSDRKAEASVGFVVSASENYATSIALGRRKATGCRMQTEYSS